MKNILTTFLLFLPLYAVHAQESGIKSKMIPLMKYVGQWEGQGYHVHDSYTNHYFQTLTVEPRLDSTLLVVETSAHLRDGSKRNIHHSITIWQYDRDRDAYAFYMFEDDGSTVSGSFRIEDGKLVSFMGNGAITDVTQINEEGVYHRYWDKKQGDGTYKRIFETTLHRGN